MSKAPVARMKIRAITTGTGDSQQTSLWLVVGGPDKENSFWVGHDKLKMVLDAPGGTAVDLSTKDSEGNMAKTKYCGHDGNQAAFMLNGNVTGMIPVATLRLIADLITPDKREPVISSEGAAADAIKRALAG